MKTKKKIILSSVTILGLAVASFIGSYFYVKNQVNQALLGAVQELNANLAQGKFTKNLGIKITLENYKPALLGSTTGELLITSAFSQQPIIVQTDINYDPFSLKLSALYNYKNINVVQYMNLWNKHKIYFIVQANKLTLPSETINKLFSHVAINIKDSTMRNMSAIINVNQFHSNLLNQQSFKVLFNYQQNKNVNFRISGQNVNVQNMFKVASYNLDDKLNLTNQQYTSTNTISGISVNGNKLGNIHGVTTATLNKASLLNLPQLFNKVVFNSSYDWQASDNAQLKLLASFSVNVNPTSALNPNFAFVPRVTLVTLNKAFFDKFYAAAQSIPFINANDNQATAAQALQILLENNILTYQQATQLYSSKLVIENNMVYLNNQPMGQYNS